MNAELQTKVHASPAQNFTPVQTGLLQRKCTLYNTPGLVENSKQDQENLTLQRSSVEPRFGHDFSKVRIHNAAPTTIQTKLTINQPNDRYEQEADRVADQVMKMPELRVQRQPIKDELIQTKMARDVTPEVTPAISSGIQSLQGGGRPLSRSERGFFEPRFGADFSNVRVHNDMRAASVAKSVNARAFTLGHNVVFGAGEYSPDVLAGRKLLAHELTHVVQQARTSQPAVLQREAEEEPLRCENPEEITDEVRNFRTEVIRQISRNLSLRNATLPAVPTLSREEAVESLISRLERTTPTPQLMNSANAMMARVTLEVLTDAPRFAFDTVRFFVCDRINLPELQITPGQRFGGLVDQNQTPIQVYYERSFQANLESFLEADDLTALRSVMELIAHEKRHVTLQGVPGITVPSTSLQAGAEQNVVNYYIEELLVTAEEIKVNALFNPQYVISASLQYFIRRYWRFIEQSVDAAELERIRGTIQNLLRTRYGRGDCDNAISTGMLSSMSFEQWYRCGSDGRVVLIPDGVTPCLGSNNTHAICGGVVSEEPVLLPGQMNLR